MAIIVLSVDTEFAILRKGYAPFMYCLQKVSDGYASFLNKEFPSASIPDPLFTASLANIPYCCGVHELGNYWVSSLINLYEERFQEKILPNFFSVLIEDSKKNGKNLLITNISSHNSQFFLEKPLAKEGFIKIASFYNERYALNKEFHHIKTFYKVLHETSML